jgi:hypothetical protein
VFERLFPRSFDNVYRGHRLGPWIFALIVLVKAIQGVNSIAITRTVVTTADGIPLEGFSAASADTVLTLFALVGFYLLVLPLQSIIVLARYRAMIPFMFLMLLVTQLGSRTVLLLHPIARTSAMPMGLWVNLVLLALTAIGFVLSLLAASRAQ